MNHTCDMANALLDALGIDKTLVRRVELILDVNAVPLLGIERYVLGDEESRGVADMVDREWRKYTTRTVDVVTEVREIVPKKEDTDSE